jgi:hypothetical protein
MRRLKLAPHRSRNQDVIEQSWKDILKLDENEIVDRRGV